MSSIAHKIPRRKSLCVSDMDISELYDIADTLSDYLKAVAVLESYKIDLEDAKSIADLIENEINAREAEEEAEMNRLYEKEALL